MQWYATGEWRMDLDSTMANSLVASTSTGEISSSRCECHAHIAGIPPVAILLAQHWSRASHEHAEAPNANACGTTADYAPKHAGYASSSVWRLQPLLHYLLSNEPHSEVALRFGCLIRSIYYRDPVQTPPSKQIALLVC